MNSQKGKRNKKRIITMNRSKTFKSLGEEKTWNIIKTDFDAIKVIKKFGRKKPRIIEFKIICEEKDLHFKHPNYTFRNVTSHFSPIIDEKRISLNKTFLKSIIKSLKKVGVWQRIVNKEFIQLNENNPRLDQRSVTEELRFLLKD
jgi:hypothetical protein